jgi:ribosomal-protein-alanine N-acetyltransferase
MRRFWARGYGLPRMSAYPDRLTTDRLIAQRPDVARDLDGYAAILGDPRVADPLFPAQFGGARTREQTEAWLERMAAHWSVFGFGPWVVRERDAGGDGDGDAGRLVGEVGLGHTIVAGAAEVEVGAVIDADRWGRGYAAELVDAALEHATELKGLRSVVAFCEPGNERALVVLRRCGFAFERDLEFHGLDVVVHRAATGPRAARVAAD